MGKLAMYGGTPVFRVEDLPRELYKWPIVNDAMLKAQADVLETGNRFHIVLASRFE